MQAASGCRVRIFVWILLSGWIVLQAGMIGTWIDRTTELREVADSAWYLQDAFDLYQHVWNRPAIAGYEHPPRLAAFFEVFGWTYNCPALYPMLMGASYAAFGPGLDAALYVSALFLVVLLLGVYALGSHLGGPWAGLFAALVAGMYPGVLGLARTAETYHPAAAAVPWLLYFLLQTDGFSRAGWCAVLGAATGVALLLKGQVAFFVWLPFAGVFAAAVVRRRRSGGVSSARIPIVGGLVAFLWMLLASAPWWMQGSSSIESTIVWHTIWADDFTGMHPVTEELAYARGSAGWAFWYCRVIARETTIPLAVLFVVGSAVLIGKRRWAAFVPLACVAGAYAVLIGLVKFNFPRFIFPALPAVAVVTGWGLAELRPRAVRFALIAAALIAFACLIAPRASIGDRFGGASDRYLIGERFLCSPIRRPPSAAWIGAETVLASAADSGPDFIAQLNADGRSRVQYGHILSFFLMGRAPDTRFVCTEGPARQFYFPIEECLHRANRWIVWDDLTLASHPDASRFYLAGGLPTVETGDGREAVVADAWTEKARETVRCRDLAGTVWNKRSRMVLWIFSGADDCRSRRGDFAITP